MKQKLKISIIVLALILSLTKLIAYILNFQMGIESEKYLYGFSQIYPPSELFLYSGILSIILLIFLSYKKINEMIRKSLYKLYPFVTKISSKNKKVNYLIISIAFTILFYLIRIRHFEYGDTWGVTIQNATTELSSRFFMSELFPIYFGFRAHQLTSYLFGWEANSVFIISSILSGGVFIYFLLLTIDLITKDLEKKLILFFLVMSSGFIALFTGIVELTPMLAAATIIYIYASIGFLKSKWGIFWPTITLWLAFWTHGSAGWFIPSLIFLHMSRLSINKFTIKNIFKIFFNKKFLNIILIALIPTILIFSYMAYETNKDFNTKITNVQEIQAGNFLGGGDLRLFVPVTRELGVYERFHVFEPKHILDGINHHVLLAPFGVLLILILILSYYKKIDFKDPILFFFLVLLLFYLVEFHFDNKDLGYLRDWDTYAVGGVIFTILGGYLLTTYIKNKSYLKEISLIIIFTNLTFTIPWIVSNIIRQFI